jgi:hypothetical protein
MNLMISHLLPLRSAEPAIMTRLLMSCQTLGVFPAFVAAFLKHFSKAEPANIAHFSGFAPVFAIYFLLPPIAIR